MSDLIELVREGREAPITLNEAARLPIFQRHGRPLNAATIYRYVAKGTTSGVKLEIFKQGSVMMTTPEACERFVVRSTHGPDAPIPPKLSPRRNRKEEAKQKLAAAGV